MNLPDVTLGEFVDLMRRLQSGEGQRAPGPVLAPLPAEPVGERYAGLSPAECRARLRELGNDALERASGGRWNDVEAREWAAMDLGIRVCLLILAGVGDDFDGLSALADRHWREVPPPERQAIKGQVRAVRAAMRKVTNLAGW